jgi:hypothetical protein
MGLAAARIEVLAFSVVMIPAFAIDTVCCSWSDDQQRMVIDASKLTITSCRTLLVASDILSNSSIQHTPPSLRTNAPLLDHVSNMNGQI